jgi:hypothetical protein
MYVDEGERDILPNELEARRAFHIVILIRVGSTVPMLCIAGYRRRLVRPIELSAGSGYSATWAIGIRGVDGYTPVNPGPIEILD